MFEVGNYVVYGQNGVCRVEAVGKLEGMLSDRKRMYYTLVPVFEKESRIFTPVDNKKVVLRAVISKEDARHLMDHMDELELLTIVDEKRKEDVYRAALMKCDSKELFRVIKMLYTRKKDRLDNGKKVIASDEKFFHLIENNLFGELAVSLGLDRDEIREFIVSRVDS